MGQGAGIDHHRAETLARARTLLDRYEQIWRDRIVRLDALLAED